MYEGYAEASSYGKPYEFHRTLIVVFRLDGFVFALHQGQQGFHVESVFYLLEDGVGYFLRYVFHPESLFHLAPSPLVVFYLVVDKEAGESFVVDKLLLCQELHVSCNGFLAQFPLLHLVEHFLRAMFGLGAESGELQQGLLLGHGFLGSLGLVVVAVFHTHSSVFI